MDATAIRTILAQSFSDSIRAKWLLIFASVYFLLAINLPLLVIIAFNWLDPGYLTLNLTQFIAVAYPYIPLLTLPMGAGVIVDERESGTLQYVMSNPISKVDFLLGRMLGMLMATTLVIVIGFGIASVFVYGSDFRLYQPLEIATCAAVLLNASMLFLAMSVSSLSRRKSTAIGIAMFVWLLFTVISDFVDIQIFSSLKLGIYSALPTILLNPINAAQNFAARVLAVTIQGLQGAGQLNPVFHQNTDLVLVATMLTWLLVWFLVVFFLFKHQDVV